MRHLLVFLRRLTGLFPQDRRERELDEEIQSNIELHIAEPSDGAGGAGLISVPHADTAPPDIFQALKEQLGLTLEPKKGPVELIVIDHVDKTPTAN